MWQPVNEYIDVAGTSSRSSCAKEVSSLKLSSYPTISGAWKRTSPGGNGFGGGEEAQKSWESIKDQ